MILQLTRMIAVETPRKGRTKSNAASDPRGCTQLLGFAKTQPHDALVRSVTAVKRCQRFALGHVLLATILEQHKHGLLDHPSHSSKSHWRGDQ